MECSTPARPPPVLRTEVSPGAGAPFADVTVSGEFQREGAPSAVREGGALNGVSHALDVLYGTVDKPYYAQMERVARECIGPVAEYLPRVLQNPGDVEGREALGLATDLGAYAIVLGSTNGAHLTSYSLVDVLSHGRACAWLNPYCAVLFALAVEKPLRLVGDILRRAGDTAANLEQLI